MKKWIECGNAHSFIVCRSTNLQKFFFVAESIGERLVSIFFLTEYSHPVFTLSISFKHLRICSLFFFFSVWIHFFSLLLLRLDLCLCFTFAIIIFCFSIKYYFFYWTALVRPLYTKRLPVLFRKILIRNVLSLVFVPFFSSSSSTFFYRFSFSFYSIDSLFQFNLL